MTVAVCLSNKCRARRCAVLRWDASHGRSSAPIAVADALLPSLIVTAKMNDVDPQAWLADVLARIAAHPVHTLDELLPWNWRAGQETTSRAA